MNDQRKTKAQLIDELQAERQTAASETAGVRTSSMRTDLAVERVRAAAMDMRSTADLQQVVYVLLAETQDAGIDTPAISVVVVDESVVVQYTSGRVDNGEIRDADTNGKPYPIAEWLAGEIEGIHSLASQHYEIVSTSGRPHTFEIVATKGAGPWSITNVPFRDGMIGYREREHHPEHDEIVAELARGLELGFLRFLDFRQVEQQNRELTIQNALERVRMRALGMQASDELGEVTSALFAQFRGLGHELHSAAILVQDEAAGTREFWGEMRDGRRHHGKVPTPYPAGSHLRETVDADERVRSTGAPWRVCRNEGEALVRWLRDLYEVPGYSEQAIEEIVRRTPDQIVQHRIFHERGLIEFALDHHLSDDDLAVAKRFTDVFDFAYSRFLELKAKEQQNHELEMERALERVRTAIARMDSSEGLDDLVDVVGQELRDLDLQFDTVASTPSRPTGRRSPSVQRRWTDSAVRA